MNNLSLQYRTCISKKFRFEAAHHLPNDAKGHKCGRLHGHSFVVQITLCGPIDRNLGWIMDLNDVAKAFEPLMEQLDHNYLNEIKGLENPTSEILAQWIYDKIQIDKKLLYSVCVEETCNSMAIVYGSCS